MTTPTVTLTFDNGPTPGVTEDVLALLSEHDVPATFFAIGSKLAAADGARLGRQIVGAGHRLGGHTWSHSTQFGVASAEMIAAELDRTADAVAAVGGDELLFRPYGAGGVIDERLMTRFAAERLCSAGYTCVLWNVLPGDWRDPDGWVTGALAGVEDEPWPVVVLHDVVDAALPRLAEFLDALAGRVTWSQDFPEACTPIRNGVPTSSFDVLLTNS